DKKKMLAGRESTVRWSWKEDKEFETALVTFPDGTPDRWKVIAGVLPGKSDVDVLKHFEDLVLDVMAIDADQIELPDYSDDWWFSGGRGGGDWTEEGSGDDCHVQGTWVGYVEKETTSSERKKGTPWTAEEHRRFLKGLEKYGKGDWRSIARNAVITKTSTQVASHAQKYFLRHGAVKKDKKRASIHDITDENGPSEGPSGVVIQPDFPRMGFQGPLSDLW
ncbi:Transcription factor DIVARICATA, partial [Linum perenne]